MSTARGRGRGRSGRPLSGKLVLFRLALSWFGARSFEDLAALLRVDGLEGLDADNVHRFHHALAAAPRGGASIAPETLLVYDRSIVAHTARLNRGRVSRGAPPIVWKYFQYLMLLFTEAYLDRYFGDREGLHAELEHAFVRGAGLGPGPRASDPGSVPRQNKLAYWSATGSGKTLLMHVNLLQWLEHASTQGRRHAPKRILLLTPNEGMSRQHLRDLRLSGLRAELFRRESATSPHPGMVRILDVHKLREEMGDKTVAVDALGRDNLVLVDEGHRGASRGERGAWLRHRNALCEEGFSFEYSATFGQAVKGDAELESTYARSILFDYSYRRFHADGFGKDYRIVNLDRDVEHEHAAAYMVACLLTFFEQQRVYRDRAEALRPFRIDRPLWVFVGGSVTASLSKREASDIVEILSFLSRYVADRRESVARIDEVLGGGLVGADDRLGGALGGLRATGWSAERVYDESLALVFNARAGGRMRVENIEDAPGELSLVIGSGNAPFGVINVGDDAKLARLCEDRGLAVGQRAFAGSMFDGIDEAESPVNVLIGAKKFMEGWNSWRVSTMGLMHVGKGEGAQVIQLFGRGVRLKGIGMGLKRSGAAIIPKGLARPAGLEVLETLRVFGVRADYMSRFRSFLREEGAAVQELQGQPRRPGRAGAVDGLVGSRNEIIMLEKPDPARDPSTRWLRDHPVVMNWHPSVRTVSSRDVPVAPEWSLREAHLGALQLAFVDLDRLTSEVIALKRERGWDELVVSRGAVGELLTDRSWYRLFIAEAWLLPRRLGRIDAWDSIARSLVKRYAEHYYRFRRRSGLGEA